VPAEQQPQLSAEYVQPFVPVGAGSIGTAMSVSAIGSLLGGIFVAGVKPDSRRTLGIVLVGFAATLVALGLAPGYWAFVALSIPLGFASAAFQSVDTVVLQQATEPAMQGRVMALQQMAWFGSTPIGALLMGWVIQISSPRVPFAIGGLAALACAAAIMLVRHADEAVGHGNPHESSRKTPIGHVARSRIDRPIMCLLPPNTRMMFAATELASNPDMKLRQAPGVTRPLS
jgi:MFS family permease